MESWAHLTPELNQYKRRRVKSSQGKRDLVFQLFKINEARKNMFAGMICSVSNAVQTVEVEFTHHSVLFNR